MKRRTLLAFVSLTMWLVVMAPVGAAPTTHLATPAAFDCDALASYWTEVYYPSEPPATIEETATARAAWDGWQAYEQMTRTELYIAQLFYDQWARNLMKVPVGDLPDGLAAFHDSIVREMDVRSRAILAYLNDDPKAYDSITDEMWQILEDRYAIGLDGVEQCGDQWVDAMGEPWDPSPDATPAATPNT